MLLATLSFASCNNGNPSDTPAKSDFDVLETKNIVLGNEVYSVDFTTNEGEKITFTNADCLIRYIKLQTAE